MVNINQNANLDNNVNAVESITGNNFGPPVLPTPSGFVIFNSYLFKNVPNWNDTTTVTQSNSGWPLYLPNGPVSSGPDQGGW